MLHDADVVCTLQLTLASLQLAASAPFLLDLLPPQLRLGAQARDDHHIGDGYGVPEDSYGVPEDSYGVPEDSYGVPEDGYGAPKPSYSTTTTSLPPCSYEAPTTTTTTTAAPSYGAPAQQQKAFPDILGFIGGIGDTLGGIIEKHKPQPEAQQYGCLSPPVDTAYGAPESQAYEAPPEDTYEAPQADTYEAPKAETYEAPQAETYEAPKVETYEAPVTETYVAPQVSYDGGVADIAVNERNNAISE